MNTAPSRLPPYALPDGRGSLRRAVLVTWAGFWLLMIVAETQQHPQGGWSAAWHAVVNEGSSALVATLLLVAQWRLAGRMDHLLEQPARWFGIVALLTLPLAFAFVPLVQALRAGAEALSGGAYRTDPACCSFTYETARFAIFYLLFSGLQFGARSYLAWTAARLHAEHEQALAREAQLLQLTQQLQPHFLFNALNTVSSLIHTDPDRADALLTRLAALLRAATDLAQQPQQPLDDELQLLRGYADIMGERYAGRVSVAWEIDAAACRCLVPALSLQPLLENCFRHVVERRREPTHIVVRAEALPGLLRVTVRDDAGQLPSPVVFGVGLGNLQRRLQVLHGERGSLHLASADGGGVAAIMELPCAC